MGIIQRDLEQRTSEKAEELAKQRTGREFSDLPANLQMDIWMDAEQEAINDIASEADFLYDQMKEQRLFSGGNGHKPKEDREEHWAELELGRRLNK